MNNFIQVKLSKKTSDDAGTVKNYKQYNSDISPLSEVPTQVWPGNGLILQGSHPLKSGHVADQVQRLNVIHQHQQKLKILKQVVSSFKVSKTQVDHFNKKKYFRNFLWGLT